MKTRIISGLIMAPLLVILYFGGWLLWAAALLIAVMGVKEFCEAWETIDVKPSKTICYVMSVLLFLTAIPLEIGMPMASSITTELVMLWMFVAVAASCIYGWKINERGTYDAVVTGMSLMYILFFVALSLSSVAFIMELISLHSAMSSSVGCCFCFLMV